jgi:hypothetical protein
LREIAYQGRQRVLEGFSFSAQRERYLELFSTLLSRSLKNIEVSDNKKPGMPSQDLLSAEPTCER